MTFILLIASGICTVLAVACRIASYKWEAYRNEFFWGSVALILCAEVTAVCALAIAGCVATYPPAPLWHVDVAGVLSLFDFLFTVLSALDEP